MSRAGSDVFAIVGAVGMYFFVSITLVFVNKIVFSSDSVSLEAPLFLTWTQLVMAVICCIILSFIKNYLMPGSLSFFPTFEYQLSRAQDVLPLTLSFLGMIVFNNLCLKYVEVSFYQVARSLTIVFNIVLSFLVTGALPASPLALAACFLVVCGYAMGAKGELNVSLVGVVFGLLSSLFVALYSMQVKKTLALVNNNTWLLLFYNNVNATFLMPLLFVWQEGQIVREYTGFGESKVWGLILWAGMLGFLINIASFLQIKHTSPLTHNVSGTLKACLQTGLAVLYFQNETTTMFWMGFLITLVGSCLYTYSRYTSSVLPTTNTK